MPVATAMISIRFETPGFSSGSWRTSVPESVTAVLNFFRTSSGGSIIRTTPGRRAARRRHQPLRLLQVLDPRALLRIDALGHLERLAEAPVEALRDVPRQLEMLPLVVADRDDVGLVEKDVAGHQHRVVEEPGGDELLLCGALLELRHAPELAPARDRAQQPRGLGVRLHVALDEDGRAVGVEARREQPRCDGKRRLAQHVRLERRRDRVQVDDAEERVALLLGRDVLPEAAAAVAQGLVARGSDAGEDAHQSIIAGTAASIAPRRPST